MEPLNLDNNKYNIIPDYELIPKYMNYIFNFNITNNSFICNTILINTDSIYNKDLQVTYISRQITRNKNFINIHGNELYKTFEMICFKGDTINFNFDLEDSIELTLIETKRDGEYIKNYICRKDEIKIPICENSLYINI